MQRHRNWLWPLAVLGTGCLTGEHNGFDAYSAPAPTDGGTADGAVGGDGGGPSCGNGRVQCGAECVELTSDPRYCGRCDRA